MPCQESGIGVGAIVRAVNPPPLPRILPTTRPHACGRRHLVRGCVTALLLLGATACNGVEVPETAAGIMDVLEDAGMVTCRERREPVPDVVTCEDDEAGDVTVGITDTPLVTISSTSESAAGPWIAADTFVLITYDDDLPRVQSLRDAIGTGDIYRVTDDGTPEVVPS